MGVAGWRFAQKFNKIAAKVNELGQKKKKILKSVNRPCHICIIIQHSQLSQKAEFGPKIAKTN